MTPTESMNVTHPGTATLLKLALVVACCGVAWLLWLQQALQSLSAKSFPLRALSLVLLVGFGSGVSFTRCARPGNCAARNAGGVHVGPRRCARVSRRG